jgi:CRP/FNR family transcriptional regulator, cyclic AMP receptor protein
MQYSPSEFRTRLEQQLTAWSLPAVLAAEIEENSIPATFEKGAIVFLRGSPANLVFWLRKGFVKLYLPHADGNRTLVTIARPGDPLGMVANVDADGRRHQIFEAQALTKCSLGLFSREHMTSLLHKLDRERVIQLLGDLNATWSALFERCARFVGLPFRERLEMVFEDLGARFGVDDKRGTLIILELSQEDLAEMIGSSRPMVSKLVGDMVEEGLLGRSEQRQFILLSQAERQSKLASSSEPSRSGKAVRASKSPTRMAVHPSIPPGRDRSRPALSAMNHYSSSDNV